MSASQEQPNLEHAQLIPLGNTGTESESREPVTVQFNPKSLTLNYQNRVTGGTQKGESGKQYHGQGTTTMSVDLLFDVTHPTSGRSPGGGSSEGSSGGGSSRNGSGGARDVREKTLKIRRLMEEAKQSDSDDEKVPPNVEFSWGNFLFTGLITSMTETLEFFDEQGFPLRASVSISMQRHALEEEQGSRGASGSGSSGGSAGASGGADPEARPPGAGNASGTPLQKLAGAMGKQGRWKDIASANDIENPRSIFNASAVDMNASASVGANAEASGGVSAGASASADLG